MEEKSLGNMDQNPENRQTDTHSSVCVKWSPPGGRFRKNILVEGTGTETPMYGSTCTVSITTSESDQSDSPEAGHVVGQHVHIQIGEGDKYIADIIDECVCSMKEGEVCELAFQSGKVVENSCELTFQSVETGENSSGLGEMQYQIKLESFHRGKESWEMTHEEKYQAAMHHKTKGIELFKSGDIAFAFKHFSKATKFLICMLPKHTVPAFMCQDYDQLQCQCYTNLAACQMKYKNYRYVVDNCTKALAIEPTNVKALFRRSQAYLGLRELEKARCDLQEALNKEPQNKAMLSLLRQLNVTEKEEEKQLSAGLSKMFSA